MKPTFFLIPLLAGSVQPAALSGEADVAQLKPAHVERDWHIEDLWKRKGGGGGGGKGGGSSGGSSSSGSGGRSGSSGSGTSSGGRTFTGPPPSLGGGRFYGGGSATPYKAGGRSPSGIAPFVLGGAVGGAAALAFWPGTWYHPVSYYPYHHPYGYHNDSSGKNESKPVGCGCDQTEQCGCDDTNANDTLKELIGNGSTAAMNSSLVRVADVNGTSTILINGSLPNGTTATENDAGGMRTMLEHAGWWPVAATVIGTVFFL